MLAALAAVVSVIVLGACSDPSTIPDRVADARQDDHPVLGPVLSDWRLPPSGDFNHDGMQDVVWRHLPSGRFAVWLMNGTRVLEQGPLMPGPPGDGWFLVNGYSDLDLDGMADFVWYDPTANLLTVWLMNGTEPRVRGPVIPGPPGDGWTCAAALDFNLDGMSDLLWYNPTTNRMTVWLMHGTEPFEQTPEIAGPEGGGWVAGYGGDLDLDDLSDVFWYNPTAKRMAIWLMEGPDFVRERGPEIPTPGGGFILAAAADFNKDTLADELWFDPGTGRITESLMRGTALLDQGAEIAGPGEGWFAGNAADCDGDGISDVLWVHAEPLRLSVWLMNGTVPVVRGPEIPGPSVP